MQGPLLLFKLSSCFCVKTETLQRHSCGTVKRFHGNSEECVCFCDCVFSGVSFQTLNWTLIPVMSVELEPGTALAVGSVHSLVSLLKKMHLGVCLLLTGAMWVCVMTSSNFNGQLQTSPMVINSERWYLTFITSLYSKVKPILNVFLRIYV